MVESRFSKARITFVYFFRAFYKRKKLL